MAMKQTSKFISSVATRHIYDFELALPSFVSGRDHLLLSEYLQGVRGSVSFAIHALPRERHWAISLPHGAFAGRFTYAGPGEAPTSPATPTLAEEAQAFADAWAAAQKAKPRLKNALVNRGWVIVKEGVRFFRKEALDYLAFHVPHPPLFHAFSAFLTFVEKRETKIGSHGKEVHHYPNRHFIVPRLRGRKQIAPAAERPPAANGRPRRGGDWSAAEDALLRRYFGRDSEGKRIKMTEHFWELLLGEPTKGGLQGMRTRAAVRARIVVLNTKLKKSLMIDGLINGENIRRYQHQCLGERACLPRLRPRLNGTYDGKTPYAEDKNGRPRLGKMKKPKPDIAPVLELADEVMQEW